MGRQLSQSTKRAMGIGEDEEEFEDLRDHWLQKQLTVYSRHVHTKHSWYKLCCCGASVEIVPSNRIVTGSNRTFAAVCKASGSPKQQGSIPLSHRFSNLFFFS